MPYNIALVTLSNCFCQSCGTIGGSLGLVDQETDALASLAPTSGINTINMKKGRDPQGISRIRVTE